MEFLSILLYYIWLFFRKDNSIYKKWRGRPYYYEIRAIERLSKIKALGSLSRNVIERSNCPVLIVRW